MNGSAPTRKMSAVAVGGAIATVVVWLTETLASLDVPNTVAVAVGVIFAWLCGYIIKDSA